MEDRPDDPLTIEEAARALRMDSETLRRLIRDGKFPEGMKYTGREGKSNGITVWLRADVDNFKYRVANAHRFRRRPDPDETPAPEDLPPGRKNPRLR